MWWCGTTLQPCRQLVPSAAAYQLSSLTVRQQEPSGDHFTPLRKFELGAAALLLLAVGEQTGSPNVRQGVSTRDKLHLCTYIPRHLLANSSHAQ
jgi:hypothetical protein